MCAPAIEEDNQWPPIHLHSSPPALILARKRKIEYLILFGDAGGVTQGLVHATNVSSSSYIPALENA